MDEIIQDTPSGQHTCDGPECNHDEPKTVAAPTAQNEELALAFLVALTPLVAFSFLAQVGLL
jgi:hypothetical protein